MLLLYNFFSAISLLMYFPWLLLKKGPKDRQTYLSERLGISRYTDTDIWVHAVSVGEVMACLPFLRRLKEEFPEKKIVFSTTTYTGQKIAREKFPEADRIMYMPWDTGLCVKKVVRELRPKIFITVETELWPVLFQTLRNSGSYIVLLNGRISYESFKGYKRIKTFMKAVLSNLDYLYMQGKGDAERIISIGAKPEKVGIMGNFKFDVELHEPQNFAMWLNSLDGKVLVAGSTHKGEEEIIIDAYEAIKKTTSDLKLVLAPRHPQRFKEVAEILEKRGLNYIRRSEINQGSGVRGQRLYDIILLDSIGELPQTFSRATITFIGGSLFPLGGHNILEPAYWGNPIIFGPHMDNFPIASDFLKEGAALMVKDSRDIAATVKDLLMNTEKAKQMGQKAKSIIDSNTGAVEKALGLVRGFLGTA